MNRDVWVWAVDPTLLLCTCAESSCVTVCLCETEKKKTHLMCFKFVLLFFFFSPYKGNTAIKGTKSAGVYSSQGDPSSLGMLESVIKFLHSPLNSHTTVMYSTGHMYSIENKCHSILEIHYYPLPKPFSSVS